MPECRQQDRLEDEHGEHGPDGVDDDAFPLENGADPPRRPDMDQQGHDHGGAGHDQHGPQQDGQGRAQIEHQPRRQRREHPRESRPQRDQPPYRGANLLQLGQPQGEPPLVQDQRHRDRDERLQQVAEQPVGVHEAPPEEVLAHRPGQEADHQQQQDGRHAQPPRDPLRSDPQHDD
jgi:hypothetical protein